MDLSAREIHEKQFHDQWRGYNQEEVDDFLDRVAEALDRGRRENQALLERIRELEEQMLSSREAEDMLKKTLITAQQAADEAINSARGKAEQLINEAEARARQAAEESNRRLAKAQADAEKKLADMERHYGAKRGELETEIERLRSYQTELKARLKSFLEQQMKTLGTLPDREPPLARIVRESGSEPRLTARPSAHAPSEPAEGGVQQGR